MRQMFRRKNAVRAWFGGVLAGLALIVAQPAMAAPVQIKPVPAAECEKLKQLVEKLVGLKLTLKNAKPDAELFSVRTSGEACLMTADGAGASGLFGDVETALDTHFQGGGWKEMNDISADGPGSTRTGYTKGGRTVIYFVATEPPEGKCEPDPNSEDLPDCDLPAGEWVWNIDIIAYDKVR